MKGTSNGRIDYAVVGTVPIDQIPRDGYRSPYEKLLRAVTKAKAGEAVKARVATPEAAVMLGKRLTSVGKGSLSVRVPKGGRYVYVAAKAARKPRKVKAAPKRGKGKR